MNIITKTNLLLARQLQNLLEGAERVVGAHGVAFHKTEVIVGGDQQADGVRIVIDILLDEGIIAIRVIIRSIGAMGGHFDRIFDLPIYNFVGG